MALQKASRYIRNPLTLIAVFAGLAEIAATGTLPVLKSPVQMIFVWYVMLFPALLVVVFFLTLNLNHVVLYAPGDFKDERLFFETLSAAYTEISQETETLRNYWKPGGTVNKTNRAKIDECMTKAGLATGPGTLVGLITSRSQAADRRKVVELLEL